MDLDDIIVEVFYETAKEGYLEDCNKLIKELGYEIDDYKYESGIRVWNNEGFYLTISDNGRIMLSNSCAQITERSKILFKLDILILKLEPIIKKEEIYNITLHNLSDEENEEKLGKKTKEMKYISSLVEGLRFMAERKYSKSYNYSVDEKKVCTHAKVTFTRIGNLGDDTHERI